MQDGTSPQGKFAGIGPESVACMAEQAGHEVNSEAITTLAEDVSYKLRQAISVSILFSYSTLYLLKYTPINRFS